MSNFSGTREAFTAAMMELRRKDDKVLFVSADSLKAMRATAFSEEFPESYVEVGIAEQAGVAVSAGLATCGMIPFIGTYAGFLTMRACEQMRTFVAYPNLNVKFVGINAGLIGGEREGVTHQFYEDLGILSSIPNITIFTPADPAQTFWAVKEAYAIDGPVYIRAGSGREVDIYDKETPFSLDGFRILKDYGKTHVVFASGFILDRVLAAADALHRKGIQIKVVDVNILYGKHPDKLADLIKEADYVFTVEDHNINGGLGSYICHIASELCPKHVDRIGLHSFAESGPAKELADAYGFSVEEICKRIEKYEEL